VIQAVKQAVAICPPELRQAVLRRPLAEQTEELRLRIGRQPTVLVRGREEALPTDRVTAFLLEDMLARATRHAVYAAEETLKNGFVTIDGGHRLGLCGTGVYRMGALTGLRELSSLNLRVARQVAGIADRIADGLWTSRASVLLVGAPGSGKTTLLRDLICQLSDRFSWRVGLVDERMEVAACCGGCPQLAVGAHTDVLSGVHKPEAMELLLRTMSPQWIAVDEISAPADVEAISRAAYCGVRMLAAVHADSLAELQSRPVYRRLLEEGVFTRFVLLRPDRSYTIEEGAA